jgi:hypothetical protein
VGWNTTLDAAADDACDGSACCTLRSAIPLPRVDLPRVGHSLTAYRVMQPPPSHPSRRRHLELRRVVNRGPGVAHFRTPQQHEAQWLDGDGASNSTYVTTVEVPPVPAGGAVEFAFDRAGPYLRALCPRRDAAPGCSHVRRQR